MSLKSLASLGRVEKEFVINSQLKIKLHTTNTSEQHAVMAELPTDADGAAKFAHLQRATLVYATDEVNGEKYGDDRRNELREFYATVQYSLLQEMFDCYVVLIGEQATILEDLKKK